MIQQILDLHIHSKYSRACSKNLELPKIAQACKIRGINIVTTGDFTHPKWFEHIKESLVEDTEGIHVLKKQDTILRHELRPSGDKQIINYQLPITKTRFIIGTELSCIKKHKDKTRRVHHLVFAPNLEIAEKFNNKLAEMGFNLRSDGRPILGLTSKQLLEIMLEVDERMMLIPAHAWTPWFGIFGSKGGYDSLEEAFEELTPHIKAIETGLSSDPLMNWRLSKLDNITLVSNSDAHSLQKLGREANVMQFNNEKEVTYKEIKRIIETEDKEKFLYTIEFYPEEGKYHVDGHRLCKFYCSPEETEKKYKGICPVCKKLLVIGVMNRVYELSDRSEQESNKIKKIPYHNLVPLIEIIADVLSVGVSSKKVQIMYDELINKIGNEFFILLHASLQKIEDASSKEMALAVDRVRKGNIFVRPGYDGEFGMVKVFSDNEKKPGLRQISIELD